MIKSLILRPMVYGFVHQPFIADVISNLSLKMVGIAFESYWKKFFVKNSGLTLLRFKLVGAKSPFGQNLIG